MNMDLILVGAMSVGVIIGVAFGYPKGYEDGKRIGYHRGRSINFKSLTKAE
jgi:hypothetical protein